MATTKLTAPNGATVSVDSSRVENLLARGFTKAGSSTATPAKKAPAKKAAPSKTEK